MRSTVLPLTLPLAEDVAGRLCATHRADVLREYSTPRDWAKSRIELPGLAWAFAQERPMLAGGLTERGGTATLWLAGCEGWTRYVKHVLRVWRAILESGAYPRYECEVHEDDPIARRFAERLGFRQLDVQKGFVLYEVTP
jgi:hypothetical protein